ncbi:response regulator transcription factor [Kocuria coralli]|uniref:Response regulator transcription factor n=1 Tax=Kocuria coralli TaxID=1461025 RepID=A0A5J5KY02_9MICC|nr:response regulator transcription factor [Kocuria coralli]KAA9394553.1 response regulator transcription factor [Kocuria coralli]
MRIVIAEDQVLLRDGLVRLLEGAGHSVVAQVGDARSLITEVNRHRPDLLIADIRMPPDYTDDGARAVRYLRIRFPSLAVLMLTQVVDPEMAATFVADAAPAFGYLIKDHVLDTESFLDRVQVVGDGGTAIDPTIVDLYLSRTPPKLAALTQREEDVLRLVASGRSNAGIAAQLVISRRTVDAHLRAIFMKLGITAAPEDNARVLAVRAWLTAAPSSAGQGSSGIATRG